MRLASTLLCNASLITAISLQTCARVFFTISFHFAAGTFTWTAPPPAWTPINGDDVRTVNFPVLNGSTNVALRWNYTLGSGETLALTSWKMNHFDIGFLTTVPSAVGYDHRFIISTSEVATLIIKNISDIGDATVECKVQTSVDAWKYRIHVEITGERCYAVVLRKVSCYHIPTWYVIARLRWIVIV